MTTEQFIREFEHTDNAAIEVEAPSRRDLFACAAIGLARIMVAPDGIANRETRTFQAAEGLPGAVWTVLIVIAVILIGFVLFAGLEVPGHIVLATAFAASTVGVLVLVKLLDYPFEGSLSLKPDDFIKTLGEVTAMVAGR